MRIRTTQRRGATLVEAAFVLPAFLLLLFGIFEYGRFLMTRQLMNNAAREGARWAVMHTYEGSEHEVRNEVDNKLSIARKQLVGYSKESNIRIFAADSSGNPVPGKNWNDAAYGEMIAVQVTGNYRPILPNLLFMDTSISLSSKSVMASEAN